MRRYYGDGWEVLRQPLSDRAIAGVAAAAAVGAWHASPMVTVVAWGIVVLVAVIGQGDVWRVAVVCLLVCLGATVRTEAEFGGLSPRAVGAYRGWARVVDDPQPFGGATRTILEIDGERFEMWSRGRARQIRVATWRGGSYVHVEGVRAALDDDRQDRVAWQHVVGDFEMEYVTDTWSGGPIDRASNRVRAAIERGASSLPGDDGALFRGLVVGDDRDQPREMIMRFRASGLSHLTAVSGQNVSFVLAAAGPLLRAMRPTARWLVTLGLIAWFVSLTRFEPSIVRAGAMAGLSATSFVLGRERSPFRLLGLAVSGLLLIDPLLTRSVGFWLSVGATAGVATVGPWLGARLGRLGIVAMPLGVTLGAQVGVVIPALLVFGRLPLVSIPANLLAVPVAGFVMLYGLPAGLVAGMLPERLSWLAQIVMFPCRVGVRWVDTVSRMGERLEPGGMATWVGWGVLVAGVGAITAMNRGRHGSPSTDR
jgi:competence protein ComEC